MIKLIIQSQMEPKDFCLKWIVHIKPGEWGYYKACVQEIARTTGLSPRTVESWGPDFEKRPDSVLVTLGKENKLREIGQKLKDIENLLGSDDLDFRKSLF